MPYEFLENIAIADAAFQAWGDTIEEMFVAASDALLKVMIENPGAVRPRDHRGFQVEETRIDMLLFQTLQEFIYCKDAERLLLRVKTVRIEPHGDGWTASVEAVGEPIDPARHNLIVDVKAVTLHRFQVEQTARGWDATVVVDV
jgi:SHS2 domain-containing protein